jgi:hypothetical protein
MDSGRRGYGKHTCRAQGQGLNISFDLARTLVVTGVPEDKRGFVQRYGKTWFDEDPNTDLLIASTETHYNLEWFTFGGKTGARTIAFDKFREQCLALRKANAQPREKVDSTKYDAWNRGELTIAEIAALKLPVAIAAKRTNFNYSEIGQTVKESHVIVQLTGSKKIEVLQKRFDKAGVKHTLYWDAMAAEAKRVMASMTKADHAMLAARSYVATVGSIGITWLRAHKASITNTELLDYLAQFEAAAAVEGADHKRLQALRMAAQLSGTTLGDGIDSNHKYRDLIEKKYPLLTLGLNYRYGSINDTTMNNHLIDYVNGI